MPASLTDASIVDSCISLLTLIGAMLCWCCSQEFGTRVFLPFCCTLFRYMLSQRMCCQWPAVHAIRRGYMLQLRGFKTVPEHLLAWMPDMKIVTQEELAKHASGGGRVMRFLMQASPDSKRLVKFCVNSHSSCHEATTQR